MCSYQACMPGPSAVLCKAASVIATWLPLGMQATHHMLASLSASFRSTLATLVKSWIVRKPQRWKGWSLKKFSGSQGACARTKRHKVACYSAADMTGIKKLETNYSEARLGTLHHLAEDEPPWLVDDIECVDDTHTPTSSQASENCTTVAHAIVLIKEIPAQTLFACVHTPMLPVLACRC